MNNLINGNNLRELGVNLQKIITRLSKNQNLLKLLYYTDKNPLEQPDIDDTTFKNEIYQNLIKIVPRIGPRDDARSVISLRIVRGRPNKENGAVDDVTIVIEVFVPLTQWIIKNENLRPFAILHELQDSLNKKTINGLGRMMGTGFDVNFFTEEMSCYNITFQVSQFD